MYVLCMYVDIYVCMYVCIMYVCMYVGICVCVMHKHYASKMAQTGDYYYCLLLLLYTHLIWSMLHHHVTTGTKPN